MKDDNHVSWEEIESALRSDQPVRSLRTLVKALINAGMERKVVLELMEEWRLRVRDQGRGADEDVVLDVMDLVVGFSGPGTSL